VRELLYGHKAPILDLALDEDDPRRRSFALLTQDKSFDGASGHLHKQ
jgi:hypothetical protein